MTLFASNYGYEFLIVFIVSVALGMAIIATVAWIVTLLIQRRFKTRSRSVFLVVAAVLSIYVAFRIYVTAFAN